MKRGSNIRRVGAGTIISILAAVLAMPTSVSAAPVLSIDTPKGLEIAQIKMTGDEFIVLKNNTGSTIADLSDYWLYDYSKTDPMTPGVSSSSQQLPAGTLNDGQALLLSDQGMATCGAAIAGKLSVSLGDSGGFLQLAKTSMKDGAVAQQVSDAVSWSSKSEGVIQQVPSHSKAPDALWYRYRMQSGTDVFGWQQANLDAADSCTYDVAVADTTLPVDAGTLAPSGGSSDLPPVTILASVETSTSSVAVVPSADNGLKPPMINELLPNPASPQTDANDEFIELYNPNGVAFDLSGFMLQTASTTSASAKTYTFPAGTVVEPHGFKALTSADTSLSLSNSGGQAWLLDPTTKVIGQSAPYGTAKDGQAWTMANGAWRWSTQATPGQANVIKAPVSKSSKSSAKTAVSKKQAGSVKGASTTSTAGATANASDVQPQSQGVAIHGYILAVVGGLAVLYAGYEYRSDIQNKFFQLRRDRGARRLARR